MANPWKLATIGMALVLTTALVTGITTAYLVRPAGDAALAEPTVAAPAAPRAAVTRVAARPVAAPVPVTTVARPAPAAASGPADCASGGDRAWRVAKPGLLGGLLGAGVGAAGGAIADGGKGAGKGAVIGGLVGAVAGSGYGAYQTQQQCGTVFGHSASPTVTAPGTRGPTPQAALQEASADRITIYHAR
jgi:hypothetical protein